LVAVSGIVFVKNIIASSIIPKSTLDIFDQSAIANCFATFTASSNAILDFSNLSI